MAKKSRKRPSRFDKHQAGCMWSLINIFDFRNVRSQKLLPDRKRGTKRVVGTGYPEDIMLESLGDSCEVCKETNTAVLSETPIIDSSRMSVKELMEEDMFDDQDQKKYPTVAYNSNVKKNHGRMRIKIDLDADEFVASGDLVSDITSVHQKKNNHHPSGSVDLNVMVEELCTRIHQKDVTTRMDPGHGQDGQLATQPFKEEDPSVIEENLCEATKVLVNHFTDEKSFNKDGRIQSSQELVEALRVLNSNKDVFLKLLRDPNSVLTKNIQNLQDVQVVEEGKFKVVTTSLEERNPGNAKQQNFFWRRFRKSETSEDLNRIVVLKPGSLPESPRSVGDKGRIERVSSYFSFAEFKRKLKHAMRIDHHGVIPKETRMTNWDKKMGGEGVAMASPSRDHFFIERIPKPSHGLKKLKDGKKNLVEDDDTCLSSEQRVSQSNIYAEARKHLAEIVGSGDVDVDSSSSKQAPKPLGRILSFSGYSSPAICSPRTDGGFRLSLDDGVGQGVDDKRTCIVMKQNSPSEPNVFVLDPCLPEQISGEIGVDNKPTHEAGTGVVEADADKVRLSDADSPEETNLIEISLTSPSEPHANTREDVETSSKCPEENHISTNLEQEACDVHEVSSSSIGSTLTCSVNEKIGDADITSDASSKPSPVSVLEPIFKEDDVSPPGTKAFTVVESFQPRQIHFEAEISSPPSDQVLYNKYNTEDNKHTFDFVKAVVQMSGLTWDELLNRSLFSDHLINPELIDEVDFLPDLLPCDFNLFFYLINEVLIEICGANFGWTLSLSKPSFVHPESKGRDIFTETWKEVERYLKMDGGGPRRTLDQILADDFIKPSGLCRDPQIDQESIGIQLQESILEDLVEELM